MPSLDKTRALVADFAKAAGLGELPQDNNGGYHLTVGEGTDVFLYGGDDETLLVVTPVAALPADIGYGLALYLLRVNAIEAETAPFVIGADAQGDLVFWGRLRIADFTGDSLHSLIDAVAARAQAFRAEVEGPE
jgi:hypothetical protein